MSTITQPKSIIPIGTVMIGGKAFNVSTNPEFVRFFDGIVRRIGGVSGSATENIQATAERALRLATSSVAMNPPKAPLRVGDGIDATSDVVGQTLAVNPLYVRRVSHQPDTPERRVDDAEMLIAARVFGGRR